MIAPCGINCGACRAFLRTKNSCPGCRNIGPDQPKTCVLCKIRLCETRTGPFCFSCEEFPCDQLVHLDKRYRTRYGMSEIENLECIRDSGMEKFLDDENRKWISGDGIICVHDRKWYPQKFLRE
jgi:hypothetical protein